MSNITPTPTPQVKKLNEVLKQKGVKTDLEHWDHHKHIDIAILNSKIYIEVDGLSHYVNPEQIKRDFKRDHFSDGDDFRTIHITNQLIDTHVDEIAEAISEIVKEQ